MVQFPGLKGLLKRKKLPLQHHKIYRVSKNMNGLTVKTKRHEEEGQSQQAMSLFSGAVIQHFNQQFESLR